MELTHFDKSGAVHMVDVGSKEISQRVAVAGGEISMQPETFRLIMDKEVAKGDVLEVARIAGIMAAKRVDSLIPLCHQLNLTSIKVTYEPKPADSIIKFMVRVKTSGKTGVEMEALTAASIVGLTIYDMCKAVDRDMTIGNIRLLEKMGGKSGHYIRKEELKK
ncbi:MAG: cyclic pyranopterin monophosphate synthase MoaC [Magnetococcales bacterium]|nr:cyclic pyranopterin monophosphate synthase MoaC [Magnetococcales bacterium]